MKLSFRLVSLALALSLLTPQAGLAFITDMDNNPALNYVNQLGFDYKGQENEEISLGEFIKVLLKNNVNIDEYNYGQFKFNDVPAEFEAYAEKARQLGLVQYYSENPVFGYNQKITIGKALDLTFKYYGLATPRYLLNEEKFATEVSNFNARFVMAPLIERAVLLGVLEAKDKKISFYENITKSEAARLIYQMQKIQQEIFNGKYNWLEIKPTVRDLPESKSLQLTSNDKYKIFEDVYKRINNEYLGKDNLDQTALFYGAISGMVDSLGDHYTVFEKPEGQADLRNRLDNRVEGIGASLGLDDKKRLVVISPLADSPAQKAGLKAKDIITKIDDTDTANMNLNQAVDKIQGSIGTTVKLTVLRGTSTLEINITRASITVPSVTAEITSNNIGVIKVRNMGLGVETWFESYVKQMADSKVKGVVLDLRNNPGGYLDSATELAEHFVRANQVVSIVKYADGSQQENKTKKTGMLVNTHLVVLVNSGTASSAEILAAALRDSVGTKIIGETSFGKGTVQELITYSDNSALKLSIANWLTPKGVNINKVGIQPDITVNYTDSDLKLGNDPQLNRALLLLR